MLYPELTVKYLAVAFIFFSSGLTLRTEVGRLPLCCVAKFVMRLRFCVFFPQQDLKSAAQQVKLHVLIQGFTLGLVPVAMLVFVAFCRYVDLYDDGILTGYVG